MSFEIGENVGPYRIMGKLGRGGMATVYKAYHANLDRYVALKVLHPAFLEDPNFLARFQREARLVAKLEHPNIVPIYDFADHEEQPYLVMKYIEGETLKAHLNRRRLDSDEIWNVVNAIGAGLGYAHKAGILHRDIKPSNVIVATDGRIYLADFGLARIAQSGESTLSSDMIMGTPQYISPEQAKGEKDLDNRTDIYSFAVMLYEMVVGQVPFSSDTPFSIIHDHIYSPLPLPHLVNPNVPDEVERVLLKALAKEREDRYESVEALNIAFKKAWDDADVDMADVTMTTPLHRIERPASAPPPADPTHSPTATTIAPETKEADKEEDTESLASTVEKPKKKRPVWLFAAIGILLLAGIIFAVNAFGQDNLFASLSEAKTEPPIQNPEDMPLPPPIGEGIPNVVADAQYLIAEFPDDPYSHLALALAYLDTAPKQKKQIYEELQRAVELSDGDPQFFEDAGYSLIEYGAWTGSAAMFLHALQSTQRDDSDEYNSLLYFFRESVYKSASQPEMPNYVPFGEIDEFDHPLSLVAEARHAFYHGMREDAINLLREAKDLKPDFPEAILLEGEMALRNNQFDKARQAFETLLSFEEISEWIYVEADQALSNLP